MANCGNCLYQGDRNADQKGETHVFCLVRANWYPEEKKCDHFREYADLNKDVRIRLAAEIRQEASEDRRIRKILRSNARFAIVTMVISFVLFWATVKLFDKYIF